MSKQTEIIGWTGTVIAACILLLCTNQQSYAQRTMKGQYNIAVQGSAGTDSGIPLGGELSFGTYLLNAYVAGWINVTSDSIILPTSHRLGYFPINIGADYMYRVASTRARSVCLYVGGGVFLGWEFYDPFKRVPSYIDTGLPDGAFIYGVAPAIDSEFFITRTVALTLGARLPISISSETEIFKLHLKAGIRINI